MRKWLERFRDTFNWGWLAYRVIWILVATGVLSAVSGAAWGIMTGVPGPILLMAAYCTLVGVVYLAMVPMAYRVLIAVQTKPQIEAQADMRRKPNYVAIRLLHEYRLADASTLIPASIRRMKVNHGYTSSQGIWKNNRRLCGYKGNRDDVAMRLV
jgi:hypothetical protein